MPNTTGGSRAGFGGSPKQSSPAEYDYFRIAFAPALPLRQLFCVAAGARSARWGVATMQAADYRFSF